MFSILLSNYKIRRVTAVSLLALALYLTADKLVVAQEEQASNSQSQSADFSAPAVADESKTPPGQNDGLAPEFNLNASVTDGLELSRQNLKHAAGKEAPAEQALPMPEPTAVAAAMPPLPPGMEPGAFSAGAARESQSDAGPLKSGASVSEYGVDWSTWMSQVADRWYFQLRRLEAQSPYEFYTDGPAQIEFTCYPNGQVSNIVLRRSCGVPMYDRMQVVALLSAVPMPPFPRGTQRTSYTLCQGWEAHARQPGESDYQPGSFGRDTPVERVQQWN